jgi:hypothetical protein
MASVKEAFYDVGKLGEIVRRLLEVGDILPIGEGKQMIGLN